MAEQDDTDAAGGVDWRREAARTKTAIDLLREVAQLLEEQEAKGVTIGECVLAVRVVGKDGVEAPYVQASVGSPLVLSALAGWMDVSVNALVQRRWWVALGLPEGT